MVKTSKRRNCKRWTKEEESLLRRTIDARPYNLHYSFVMVAESLDRTEKSVASHWYQISKYNGTERPKVTLWNRFTTYIKGLFTI